MFYCHTSLAVNKQNLPIVGVILSGGPNSVYDQGSPHVHASVWEYIETKKLLMTFITYLITRWGRICQLILFNNFHIILITIIF